MASPAGVQARAAGVSTGTLRDADLQALGRLQRRQWLSFAGLAGALAVLVAVAVAVGSVSIPLAEVARIVLEGEGARTSWETIVEQVRAPRAITAALAGAALGVAGLQLQTIFRNPLADPFVLGINAGASAGVAAVVLVAGTAGTVFAAGLGWLGDLGTAAAATVGAGLVGALVLAASLRVRSMVTVLLVGLMVGYLVASLVAVLLAISDEQRVMQFVLWGFGSFRGVTWSELRILAPAVGAGLLIAGLTTKQLNALALGESYAQSMGLHVRWTRVITIGGASLLAGVVTAFAGPIGFLGLAVPHLARAVFGSSDHRVLTPAVVVMGGIVALVAELVSQLPGIDSVLPLNAVTALIGAPVVVVVLLRSRRGTQGFVQ